MFENIKSSRKLVLLTSIIVLIAIIYAVFYPVIYAKTLTIDDDQYFNNNVLVQNPSIESTIRFFREVTRPSTVGGYYQPVAMVSLMLDYGLGGSSENLKPTHITALTIHVINVCLLFYLLYLLFCNVYGSFIAALLYGVHPLTVEVVAWVSERKTLVATMFALICILNYILFSKKRKKINYIISVTAFLAALMSKPTVIMIPFVLIILDYWSIINLNKSSSKTGVIETSIIKTNTIGAIIKARLVEKLPYALLMSIFMGITYLSQAKTSNVKSVEVVDIFFRLFYVIGFYFRKFFYPVHLTVVSPDPLSMSVWDYRIWIGVLAVVALVYICVESFKRGKGVLCYIAIFYTILFPTMGLVDYSFSIVWIKYMYFPVISVAILNTDLLTNLYKRYISGQVKKQLFIASNIVFGVIIVMCIILTRNYISMWKNSYTFLSYSLKYVTDSGALYGDYGIELQKMGKTQEAVEAYNTSIKLGYDVGLIYNNLGTIYGQKGDYEKAVTNYKKAIENSREPLYYQNYALALKKIGKDEDAIKVLEMVNKLTDH